MVKNTINFKNTKIDFLSTFFEKTNKYINIANKSIRKLILPNTRSKIPISKVVSTVQLYSFTEIYERDFGTTKIENIEMI